MEEKRLIKRKQKALKSRNLAGLAAACNDLGDHYYQAGKFMDAADEYQQEAKLYLKLNKTLEMAKAHRMVGETYMMMGQFDKAKTNIHKYLDVAKKLGNKVEQQRAYVTLGRAHLLHGQSTSETSATTTMEQLKQSEKAFLRSILIIKELSGQTSKLERLDMQARSYLNIGVVMENMEKFEESIKYVEKAIQISKEQDLFELTFTCYISMSLLYNNKIKDSSIALRYCNYALEAAKRLPEKVKKICEALLIKSEILINEGDFASAKQILTKAYKKNSPNVSDRMEIEKKLRVVVKICEILDELVVTSLGDYEKLKGLYEKLGDGCCQLLNFKKALDYYQKMLTCAQNNNEPERNLIPIYVSLYETYKDNKEYDKALEYLRKEYDININEPAEAFTTLCSIADICEMQNQSFWEKQKIYETASTHVSKIESPKKGKFEKILLIRMWRLRKKHNMNSLVEELESEAKIKGINLQEEEAESDAESEISNNCNTPNFGADICLDDLTDLEASDLDETEKPRPFRATRGTRSLTIKRNNKGETQLHQACIAGNLELVKRLLDQGHVVNVRDHAGWLPLHEACNQGHTDIVALLLERGAASAINDKGGNSCDGITPLYDACSNGFLEVAELLIERGADITVKTDFGETPVDGLDKWRSSANLTDGEQAQYVQVREKLVKPLTKLGVIDRLAKSGPLTNNDRDENDSLDSSTKYSSDSLSEDEINAEHSPKNNNFRWSTEGKSSKDIPKRSPRERAVGLEYKNLMEQVKHPKRSTILVEENQSSLQSNTSLSSQKQKRSAFLDSEEVDVDNWLIDDIGPEKKKRRYQTPTTELLSTTSPHKMITDSMSRENLYESVNIACDQEPLPTVFDAFEILNNAGSSTQNRQKQSKKLRLSRSSSISSSSSLSTGKRLKSKHQSSLLDNGFCRFRGGGCSSGEDSNDALAQSGNAGETDSSNTIQILVSPAKSANHSTLQIQSASFVSPTVSFKIKVENEMLLVSVDRKKLNDTKIGWLAMEAARRYYNIVGLKPILRLKTADGFAYEENDVVAVAMEQNMILATAVEWEIAPLAQRYEEMCHKLKRGIDPTVKDLLQRAQISNEVNLSRQFKLTHELEPIFKAMSHQTNVRVIDISFNFASVSSCRLLASSLKTMRNLKTLSLSHNFISCDNFELLVTALTEEDGTLDELEELNLSTNPLGDNALRFMEKFLRTTKSLQKLNISNCQLTQLHEYDLRFDHLTEFYVNHNQLTCTAMQQLLLKLNCSRLQCLNLGYTAMLQTTDMERAEYIADFFESGNCEKFKFIAISGCHLTDNQMYRIADCLSKANDLDQLDISDNNRISSVSLLHILRNLPQLRLLLVQNAFNLLDEECLQKLCELKRAPKHMALTLNLELENVTELYERLDCWWRSVRGEKADVSRVGPGVTLICND